MSAHFFLVAGEPSGDLLGARLIEALRRRNPNAVFSGIGGRQMQAQGLKSLFPIEDLSVMGLAEVLPRLPLLLRRIRQTVEAVCASKPQMLITIDSPDFSFRVAQKVGKLCPGVLRVHCVAPTVWAWRPGRARKVSGFLDHLLALFPFEPPYFEKEGLSCDWIGHPLLASGAAQGDGAAFRRQHGLAPEQKILCLLPGSRTGEIQRHLPVFLNIAHALRQTFPDLAVVLPTLPHFAADLRVQAGPGVMVVESEHEKYAAFAASSAALAASGTVTLELALAGLPAVVAYKVNGLTAFLGRRLIRIPYVGLVSILLGRRVMPEFLQENCAPGKIIPALMELLENPQEAARQKKDLAEAVQRLAPSGGVSPADRAADVILSVLEKRGSLATRS